MLKILLIIAALASSACSTHPTRVHCDRHLERINPITSSHPAARDQETPQEPKP